MAFGRVGELCKEQPSIGQLLGFGETELGTPLERIREGDFREGGSEAVLDVLNAGTTGEIRHHL